MIQVNNLTKHYDNGLVKALNGVSFCVRKGELVSVMGNSGSGKSTLLNLIGTIDTPTGGNFCIDGKDIQSYQPVNKFRATYIGFIFQFHNLLPNLTLLENVELPMYVVEKEKSRRRNKARRLLERMHLSSRMEFLPTHVSGGERQRAAIARALANNPCIILADEPTGSVDSETGEDVFQFMVEYCRKEDVTMIVATHNKEISTKTDRTLYLRNGLLV